MASDDSDGFLAKVARLVRRPASVWPDSDAGPSSGLSDKQALKEAIERKKRNDFVRKREFDMLRAIRRREQGATDREARPSFFQSSHPSRGDGREVTKRKIDEIEAQMSTHWWQQKPGEERAPERLQAPVLRGAGDSPAPAHLQAFEASDWGTTVQGAPLPTQPAQEDQWPTGSRPGARMGAKPRAGPSSLPVTFSDDSVHSDEPLTQRGASTIPQTPTDWAGLAHDICRAVPALEAAAVHFINDDLAQTERLLKDAVNQAGGGENRQLAGSVLLDFYRVTGRQTDFEAFVGDWAAPADGAAIPWRALAEPEHASPATNEAQAVWACPAQLDVRSVATLKSYLDRAGGSAHVLDWTALGAANPEAAGQLLAVLDACAQASTPLHWVGHTHLRRRLQASTPSGRRENHAVWWQLRLAVLRLLGCSDEFDLTALDYCVTYGVTPPDWVAPACTSQLHERWPPDATAPPAPPLVLRGRLRGDVATVLAALETQAGAADVLHIDCSGLLHADLVAAGALLQWGKALKGRGRRATLDRLHRLLVIALHVVGVDETLQLRVRAD